jgi:hypothetical protein
MDNTTLLITLICVGVCAIPFIAVLQARKKRRTQLFGALKQSADDNDSQLTHYELEGNLAVAIDSKKGFFYFLNLKGEKSEVDVTDLLEYKACQVVKEFYDDSDKTLKRVLLQFEPLSGSKKEKTLVCYDREVNFQASGELQFIEKWSGILQELIKGSETIDSKLDHKVVELID